MRELLNGLDFLKMRYLSLLCKQYHIPIGITQKNENMKARWSFHINQIKLQYSFAAIDIFFKTNAIYTSAEICQYHFVLCPRRILYLRHTFNKSYNYYVVFFNEFSLTI